MCACRPFLLHHVYMFNFMSVFFFSPGQMDKQPINKDSSSSQSNDQRSAVDFDRIVVFLVARNKLLLQPKSWLTHLKDVDLIGWLASVGCLTRVERLWTKKVIGNESLDEEENCRLVTTLDGRSLQHNSKLSWVKSQQRSREDEFYRPHRRVMIKVNWVNGGCPWNSIGWKVPLHTTTGLRLIWLFPLFDSSHFSAGCFWWTSW